MLEKNDIELLKKAKKDGKSLDEIITISEMMVADNELKERLLQIKNELNYKADEIINNMFDEIKILGNQEKMLDFIIKESFKLYNLEVSKETQV